MQAVHQAYRILYLYFRQAVTIQAENSVLPQSGLLTVPVSHRFSIAVQRLETDDIPVRYLKAVLHPAGQTADTFSTSVTGRCSRSSSPFLRHIPDLRNVSQISSACKSTPGRVRKKINSSAISHFPNGSRRNGHDLPTPPGGRNRQSVPRWRSGRSGHSRESWSVS